MLLAGLIMIALGVIDVFIATAVPRPEAARALRLAGFVTIVIGAVLAIAGAAS